MARGHGLPLLLFLSFFVRLLPLALLFLVLGKKMIPLAAPTQLFDHN